MPASDENDHHNQTSESEHEIVKHAAFYSNSTFFSFLRCLRRFSFFRLDHACFCERDSRQLSFQRPQFIPYRDLCESDMPSTPWFPFSLVAVLPDGAPSSATDSSWRTEPQATAPSSASWSCRTPPSTVSFVTPGGFEPPLPD